MYKQEEIGQRVGANQLKTFDSCERPSHFKPRCRSLSNKSNTLGQFARCGKRCMLPEWRLQSTTGWIQNQCARRRSLLLDISPWYGARVKVVILLIVITSKGWYCGRAPWISLTYFAEIWQTAPVSKRNRAVNLFCKASGRIGRFTYHSSSGCLGVHTYCWILISMMPAAVLAIWAKADVLRSRWFVEHSGHLSVESTYTKERAILRLFHEDPVSFVL